MKVDKLETHDRLKHFTKQSFSIDECCQNLIDQRPFGEHPFYIFAHPRTDDDGVTKRMIWQPRLTKPKSQTNSMLFKAYPGKDLIDVIWIIPDRHLWPSYQMGQMTENSLIEQSIFDFQFNRAKLDRPAKDDLSDEKIEAIYREISIEARRKKAKLKTSEPPRSP